ALALVTACPSIDVIVSPAASPACAAAPPDSTLVISAPPLVSATPTPRNAVAPMWTVLDEVPASIWPAMLAAWLIGIAYPRPVPDCPAPNRPVLPAEPAVSIPMTWPEPSTSGPPESPATTSASVAISPDKRCDDPPLSSPATIDWSTAVIDPA